MAPKPNETAPKRTKIKLSEVGGAGCRERVAGGCKGKEITTLNTLNNRQRCCFRSLLPFLVPVAKISLAMLRLFLRLNFRDTLFWLSLQEWSAISNSLAIASCDYLVHSGSGFGRTDSSQILIFEPPDFFADLSPDFSSSFL